MKRIIALICAALCMCAALCSCDGINNTVNSVKNKASEAVSGADNNKDRYSGDNKGLLDDNRETVAPTNPAMTESELNTELDETEGVIEENIDEMIDNGEVEDGDGNVGDLENSDGDPYTDENAAEDGNISAQDQYEADDEEP